MEREGIALIKLGELLKLRVREVAKQFRRNYENKTYLMRYFGKVIANYEMNKKLALLKMKLLPNKKKSLLLLKDRQKQNQNQLRLFWKLLAKKYYSKVGYSFNSFKLNSIILRYREQVAIKAIISSSKVRKEQALKILIENANNNKRKS